MSGTTVKELMNPWCVRAREEDDLALATQMMLWAGVRHLPVVRGARVVGVVSNRDILGVTLGAGRKPAGVRVSEAMSSPAEVIGPEEDAGTAAARMADRDIGCLPVVDAGALVGMLSALDARGGDERRSIAVTPETGLEEAAALMEVNVIRHLPVVDGARRVVGILSDRDLRAGENAPGGVKTVGQAMTRDVVTVGREASLAEVAMILAERRIGALPVVDADGDGLLVGMTSAPLVRRSWRSERSWSASRWFIGLSA